MSSPDPHSPARRTLIKGAVAGMLTAPFSAAAPASAGPGEKTSALRAGFSQDDTRIRLYSPAISRPGKIVFIADTHLFRDDARGEPFRQYSGRMARAYNKTRQFRSGDATDPEESFTAVLKAAKKEKADALVLGGDILSYPSEAGVDWLVGRLRETDIPWIYTAGNHDWHYEGMEGTSAELRSTWTAKRLTPLYQGENAMMAARDLNGVNMVTIDNSTYEILPEQLAFFKRQAASGQPMILCVHIPMYVPGKSYGFGCGHPGWGAAVDKTHATERRPKWREKHTAVTMDFHREVFSAPNLLGIFTGHTHRMTMDLHRGIPQFVTPPNFGGGHLIVETLPVPGV